MYGIENKKMEKGKLLAAFVVLAMIVCAFAAIIPTSVDADAVTDIQVYDNAEDTEPETVALADAISNQKEGQIWELSAGTYTVDMDMTLSADNAPGITSGAYQAGWIFPIFVDNLTIRGVEGTIITTDDSEPNGSWATQNFITVFSNGVTLENLNIIGKETANKDIEVLGTGFSISNVTIGSSDRTVGGSLYFNGAVTDANVEGVTIYNSWISTASVAEGTTVALTDVTIDNSTIDADRSVPPYGPISTNGAYNATDVNVILNDWTFGDEYSVASGVTMTINGDVQFTNLSIEGAVVNNGTVTINGTASGTIDNTNGTVITGDESNITDLDISGGTTQNSDGEVITPKTGLDQSIYAIENADLSFSGEVYLAGSLVIPEDKSLTFRSGSTLDLNGKTLTVEGTLVIESGAQVFGNGGENIILASTGSIQNDGVIGYGSEVTVKTTSADGGSVTMMNIEGISFGIETTYKGAKASYTLTVTGDVYATAGDFTKYTLSIAGAKIVGDFTTDTETVVTSTDAVISKDATYTMEGTITGSITMTDGSALVITGTANGTSINAETGDFKTADKSNATISGFKYATSKVTLTDVTDVELYVQSSTYTEDKTAMTEQALYIRGTTSYVGEAISGSIIITNTNGTYGDVTNPAVVKIAEEDILALDAETEFNGDGIVVLGQIQVNDKSASKVTQFVGTKYTVLDVADKTKGTTYITNFESALGMIAQADKQTITVYGEVEVDTSFVLADGQTIALSTTDIPAKMTIGTDAKVEMQKGSKITGTVEEVQGILYVYKGGVLSNEPNKYAVSGTNKTTGDKMYAGLEAAIANSQTGDVITVVAKGYDAETGVVVKENLSIPADRTVVVDNGKVVTFNKNLTIDEGATLTNKGTVKMVGEKAVVAVNGIFDNTAGALEAKADANVNANGQYILAYTEPFPATDYTINGAYYNSEGKYIVTTFAKAVTATGAIEGDQPVTVIGKITESGEVTVDTDNVTIIGEASLGTVTIDNADIAIEGTLTATVNGAYGAEGSTSAASIVLTKATDMTVSNYSEIDAMNVTNWYNSISAVNGNVNIASGEVILTAYGNATADENSVLKVSSGATLIVDAESPLNINNAKYLTVEGTVIIESPVTFNADVIIDGTLDVRDTLTVESTKTLTVTGTLTVSADEENPGTLTVEGRLNVGETPELVSTTATGTANGTITVSGGVVVVYNGASVVDATILSGVTEQEPTSFVVNGYDYATVYGAAKVDYLDDEIIDLKDIKGDSTDTHAPIDWYADGAKIEAPANVAVGTYAEVSTTLAWEDVNVTVSVGPGLEVYVDDLKVEGKTAFAVGEHKITVYIKPNYEGTPEITLNGQAITGDSFTLTADMIDGENILYVTGVSPADSTIVIDGGNNGGDDGLGLTDILLIILVILIVIMAIMVAMRLMRS